MERKFSRQLLTVYTHYVLRGFRPRGHSLNPNFLGKVDDQQIVIKRVGIRNNAARPGRDLDSRIRGWNEAVSIAS